MEVNTPNTVIVERIRGYLKEKQLHLGDIPLALQPPFDIRYPFEVALLDKTGTCVGVIAGGYNDLRTLQN